MRAAGERGSGGAAGCGGKRAFCCCLTGGGRPSSSALAVSAWRLVRAARFCFLASCLSFW